MSLSSQTLTDMLWKCFPLGAYFTFTFFTLKPAEVTLIIQSWVCSLAKDIQIDYFTWNQSDCVRSVALHGGSESQDTLKFVDWASKHFPLAYLFLFLFFLFACLIASCVSALWESQSDSETGGCDIYSVGIRSSNYSLTILIHKAFLFMMFFLKWLNIYWLNVP